MFAISIQSPDFLCLWKYVSWSRSSRFCRFSVSCSMTNGTMGSTSRETMINELSIQSSQTSSSRVDAHRIHDLRFDRLQVSEKELIDEDKLEFAQFVAREAVIDEEYWTAAWLRAESHWEGGVHDRYLISHMRQFAEQEFNAIKRRCIDLYGQRCKCIVAVRKQDKIAKRTVLKSVVGTLDLSIRFLIQGETFPGERVKAPMFCSIDSRATNRYGYVANVCVSKSARRQGIASNMMQFAINVAKSNGIEDVYVHVHRNNMAAQDLYKKLGFEIVEVATAQLSKEQTYLLRCKA